MNWNDVDASMVATISKESCSAFNLDDSRLSPNEIIDVLKSKILLRANRGYYDAMCVFPLDAVNDVVVDVVCESAISKGFLCEASEFKSTKLILKANWKHASGFK